MAVPLKPEYGPTLGRLFEPRWQATAPAMRRLIQAGTLGLLFAAVALALTLLNATYSHGGRLPFSFSYRSLYRVAPDPGGFVKIERRRASGALQYSYAVEPLHLPPYSGALSGELPLYAASYVAALSRRIPGFVYRGEGRTRVNTAPAYGILYTALVEGREMYGREILLLPERPGVREGVDIAMLTAPGANKQIEGPAEVATTGVLQRPLRSFSFG